MDHALVRRLQVAVGERLAERGRQDTAAGRSRLTGEDERQYAQRLILQAIHDYTQQRLSAGLAAFTPDEERKLADAIKARLFGAGRLQLLLDDPQIENVDINGADEVWITYADGRRTAGDPVAETDEELIEQIQMLGSYAGLNSRPFDNANPELDMRLPDGSRLSALMRATARPAVSIRRHRLHRVFVEDLVANGTMSSELGAFLRAIILARKNVMVAGATNSGKTTTLRAMINCVPATERIITCENSLELGLRRHPELHPNVIEVEAILPNSEGFGGLSMAQIVRRTLRQSPDRVIVGEVLGPEIVTMLNAMSQGNDGSLSTIHARTPRMVFDRIATYARQSEERLDAETAYMLIAGALDFVVFMEQARPGQLGPRRYVSSVLEVNGYDGRVQSSEVWTPGPDGRAIPNPHVGVSCLNDLLDVGYEPIDHYAHGGWGR